MKGNEIWCWGAKPGQCTDPVCPRQAALQHRVGWGDGEQPDAKPAAWSDGTMPPTTLLPNTTPF